MSGRSDTSFLRLIFVTILATCLSPSISHAQEIAGVDFTVNGSRVEITYDIVACSGSEDYDVRVFLGQDGDLLEIKQGLRGDLEHVTCGSSNTIVWDVLSDREELKGPVFFAVEILRTHPVVFTEEYPIAYEDDRDRSAGSVPYGDAGPGSPDTYLRQQRTFLALARILQFGAWIASEQTRAAIRSHGRPHVVFEKRSGTAVPQRTRQR